MVHAHAVNGVCPCFCFLSCVSAHERVLCVSVHVWICMQDLVLEFGCKTEAGIECMCNVHKCHVCCQVMCAVFYVY